MTAVSQLIPTYATGGISDQPDELKRPGQVRDAVNVFPDLNYGLVKRPGLTEVEKLVDRCSDSNVSSEGSWFSFYRENTARKGQEVFIGCVGYDGKVNVWDAVEGNPVKIYYSQSTLDPSDIENISISNLQLCPASGADYLKHNLQDFLQFLSVNNYTFITNPGKAVTMSDNRAEKRPYEAFVEITQLVYGREYRFEIDLINDNDSASYTQAKEIKLIDTGDFSTYDDPSCPANLPPTTATLDVRHLREGTPNDQKELEVEFESVGVQVAKNNGKSYECEYRHYATLIRGGRNIKKGDVFLWAQEGNFEQADTNDPFYKIEVTKQERYRTSAEYPITGVTTDNDGSTVETINGLLEQLKDKVQAEGFTAERVGNGLYITKDQPFTVSTSEKDLFNILSNEDSELENPYITVNNVSRLPIECKDGIIAKVANAFSDNDDYWVQFFANYGDVENAGDNAPATGYWEEVPEPGGKVTLNSNNMPHLLVYARENEETVMVIAPAAWKDRDCGTEDFNPSFVDFTINNLTFFQNRLVALSQENVIMSRAGELLNFFPVSALAVATKDPIDVSATTNYSSVLQDAIVINNGLVIFSNFQQFQFATDSDVLDPTTAKISEISRYDYNINSRPINLGTNIGFMGGNEGRSRFYEMTNVFREGPVDVLERSKIVSKSIAPGLNLIADAKDTGLFIAGKSGEKLLWCYRYFKESSQRELQSAWFKWELPHKLIYHTILEDVYYVVMEKDDGETLLASLNVENREGPYTDLDEDFTMSITLPTIYAIKNQAEAIRSDTTSSLTIHRMKLNTGETNYFVVEVKRAGKDTYEVIHEQTFMDGYIEGEEPVTTEHEQVVPIYDRNVNITTKITSDYGPFQLYSMSWEGDYNQRYYKRG